MSIILPCYDTRLACSWWIAYTFCMCCSTLPSSFLRLIRILCSMSKSMSTCCYWAMCSTDYRDGPTCRVRSWLCLFLLGRLLRKESLSSAFITDFSIRLSLICLYLFSCFSYSLRVYFSLFFCGGSLNKLSISSIIFLVCSISLSIMLFSSRIYCAIAESSYWAHWSWYWSFFLRTDWILSMRF